MVEYRLVKHCRRCSVRFVVSKSESRVRYCPGCYKKVSEGYAQALIDEKKASEKNSA